MSFHMTKGSSLLSQIKAIMKEGGGVRNGFCQIEAQKCYHPKLVLSVETAAHQGRYLKREGSLLVLSHRKSYSGQMETFKGRNGDKNIEKPQKIKKIYTLYYSRLAVQHTHRIQYFYLSIIHL